MKIADLPERERPREKAKALGIGSLSDAELLALLLGKGTRGHSAIELAFTLLKEAGALSSLSRYSLPELARFPGIKEVKGIELLAEFELAKRIKAEKERFLSYSPARLADYLRPRLTTRESAYVFALDGRGKIQAEKMLSEGSESGLAIEGKDVLATAMRLGGSRFVFVHTHPSGISEPSRGDILFTNNLANECTSLSIRLFDHLIVAEDSFFSFAENGLL